MDDAPTARQGLRLDASDLAAAAVREVVVDYRGDVTIHGEDGPVVGYVFDCVTGDAPVLRVMPADGGAAVSVALADVATIEFTGRDTAEGKSFETWVKKYVEQKGLRD
jgi:hypothetical protein